MSCLGLYIHGGQKMSSMYVMRMIDVIITSFLSIQLFLPSTLMFCLDSADVTFFCRDLYESK